MSELQYKLSDRPNWWLTRLFKWLSVISLVLGLFTWVISEITYRMLETSFRPSLENGGATVEEQEYFLEGISGRFEGAATFFTDLLFVVVFLWLLAIAIDKLDQLVWLNASNEDRSEILKRRIKKNNVKNQ